MIVFENASFGYDKRNLIYDDLSFELQSGRIYGLFGKTGRGNPHCCGVSAAYFSRRREKFR
jgi:ABC-type multidrug transport system fused ATPase/permease subunit